MGENRKDCVSEVGFVLRVLLVFKPELVALLADVVWLITSFHNQYQRWRRKSFVLLLCSHIRCCSRELIPYLAYDRSGDTVLANPIPLHFKQSQEYGIRRMLHSPEERSHPNTAQLTEMRLPSSNSNPSFVPDLLLTVAACRNAFPVEHSISPDVKNGMRATCNASPAA